MTDWTFGHSPSNDGILSTSIPKIKSSILKIANFEWKAIFQPLTHSRVVLVGGNIRQVLPVEEGIQAVAQCEAGHLKSGYTLVPEKSKEKAMKFDDNDIQ